MIHVRQIREFIEEGESDKALTALDDLLLLGPRNTEALKLKAYIFQQEGRFLDEEKVWQAIIDQDPEDLDAIEYIYRRHIEEREHFYFTDELPQGKRYLANPRSLVNMSLVLLFGCMLFLILSNYSQKYLFLADSQLHLLSFGMFVIVPVLGIVAVYLKTLRDVMINSEGIKLTTHLQNYQFFWKDVKEIHIAHDFLIPAEAKLSMIFIPKDTSQRPIEINLSQDKAAIRARTFFIGEIGSYFGALSYSSRSTLQINPKLVRSF